MYVSSIDPNEKRKLNVTTFSIISLSNFRLFHSFGKSSVSFLRSFFRTILPSLDVLTLTLAISSSKVR